MAASRVLAALAAALALGACGLGGPPAASPTPTPPSTASPTPHASASTSASCRLPVAAGDGPTDGNPAHGTAGHGGFVALPGGTFTADPASLGSYDLAVRKWVPVPRAWISPDGTKYVWPEYRSVTGPATGIIHVTDAASGADRSLTVPAPSMPVSYESAGVYITRVIPNSDAPAQGLSLLDPASGALKQVIADGSWRAIGTDSAYGVDLDASAPPPAQAGPGAGNRLRSVELATGTPHNLETFPGTNVTILGTQGNLPVLLLLRADRAQVRAGTATLYDQPAADPPPSPPLVIDGSTLWLGGAGAVWRSVGGAAFQKITVPLQFSSVAGSCR